MHRGSSSCKKVRMMGDNASSSRLRPFFFFWSSLRKIGGFSKNLCGRIEPYVHMPLKKPATKGVSFATV